MLSYQNIFERYELKYIINAQQAEVLRERIKSRVKPDEYGKSTICNTYYDTPTHLLIRNSIEKPVYKEKLRMRSYGIPSPNNAVFVELKKKYRGIVYKRRASMSYPEALEYLNNHGVPSADSQIIREINRFIEYYNGLYPAMFISYDRLALFSNEDKGLRITFDDNIIWRDEQTELDKGVWGSSLLEDGMQIMELKLYSAMPLWLSGILDELKIYPASYSKYGNAYKMLIS